MATVFTSADQLQSASISSESPLLTTTFLCNSYTTCTASDTENDTGSWLEVVDVMLPHRQYQPVQQALLLGVKHNFSQDMLAISWTLCNQQWNNCPSTVFQRFDIFAAKLHHSMQIFNADWMVIFHLKWIKADEDILQMFRMVQNPSKFCIWKKIGCTLSSSSCSKKGSTNYSNSKCNLGCSEKSLVTNTLNNSC